METITAGGVPFFAKISDLTPTATELEGGKAFCVDNASGEIYADRIISQTDGSIIEDTNFIVLADIFYIANEDFTMDLDGTTIAFSKGIWVGGGDLSLFDYTFTLSWGNNG